MADFFGRDATKDMMEYPFRAFRQQAEVLKREAAANGVKSNAEGAIGGRNGVSTPKTPRSSKGGISKPGSQKSGSKTAKSLKTNFDTTPTKNQKYGLGHGANRGEAISLDESDEDGVFVKDEIKKEMTDLLFGNPVKPKSEKRQSTRLFNITPENEPEKVDSQTNGYVASPEPEMDDFGSEYEYDDMA